MKQSEEVNVQTELANVTTKVIKPIEVVIAHRRALDQFFGFAGSCAPSNSTKSERGVLGD
jgi:hypothetical protein